METTNLNDPCSIHDPRRFINLIANMIPNATIIATKYPSSRRIMCHGCRGTRSLYVLDASTGIPKPTREFMPARFTRLTIITHISRLPPSYPEKSMKHQMFRTGQTGEGIQVAKQQSDDYPWPNTLHGEGLDYKVKKRSLLPLRGEGECA
ncbi:hypothetical protein RF11_10463 [Thelohanellus kitauei]|uniref:Uncharacterized protein n=1 Tax=Thelohanellus kitauei TaxID=669202 RepID=A0A0C2JZT1_THEKT|nr:hypothetical protein RF11_10463 [Thelohanellus kitauei]